MSIATEIERLQTAKSNIKSAIESKGVTVGNGTLDTYAEKIDQISGGDPVSDFWDIIHKNLETASSHDRFFNSNLWNDETFKPKKDIVLKEYSRYFLTNTKIKDLKACLDDKGIKIDFSNAQYLAEFFSAGAFEHIGVIDLSTFIHSVNVSNMFLQCRELNTIDKIKLGDNAAFGGKEFINCVKLENILFEGILKTSMMLDACSLLSKASIQNIIGCLSSDSAEQSLTLNKTAVNKAFESSAGANDGSTSQQWLDLIAIKPNWTISLV